MAAQTSKDAWKFDNYKFQGSDKVISAKLQFLIEKM